MKLPNLIIAGTGRAGSTSLFRYLSMHPEVCASYKKELMFFNTYKNSAKKNIEEYAENFKHCNADKKIIMEGTPHYLLWGQDVAHIIADILPGVKLIFILREPTERFLSIYRNEKNVDPEINKLSFDEFVNIAINATESGATNSQLESRLVHYLMSGCYIQQLTPFFDYFPPNQLKVFFYDDFKEDTLSFVQEACRFIQIDPSFFRDFSFSVENKTRAYKIRTLHRLAYSINLWLEKPLNRYPRIRQLIRSLYLKINEQPIVNAQLSSDVENRLTTFFSSYNNQLKDFLICRYPEIKLPRWLQ